MGVIWDYTGMLQNKYYFKGITMNDKKSIQGKVNLQQNDAKYNNVRDINIETAKYYNPKDTYFIFDISDNDKWQGVYAIIIK